MSRRIAMVALLALTACSNDHYLVVTVQGRPNVHGAASLKVTQKTMNQSRSDTLQLAGHVFPATFSIATPPPDIALDLHLEADDASGSAVAFGDATVAPGETSASVMLAGTDFVVNTDYAMDQFLSNDYEANGLQLAATPDGNITVAFRDNCGGTGMCTMYARRFDPTGEPVSTVAAAGTNQFNLSATLTNESSTPAIAVAGSTTLAFWDAYDTTGGGTSVACRSIDAMGNESDGQLPISTDVADVVAAASLSNDNVAVAWQVGLAPTDAAIHTIVVKPDCTTIPAAPVAISTTEGTNDGPNRADMAASGNNNILYAWIVDGGVHVRTASNALSPTGNDTLLIPPTATLSVEAVRVAPLGAGFAVAVRWADEQTYSGPGKMELYLVSATGALIGGPTLITDQSLSDFVSGIQSFGMASRSDGALLVAWHVCDMAGDANTCVVYGRMFRPTGVPVGDAFPIPTTKSQGQTGPSVVALDGAFAVAWSDTSMEAPDTQGSAVRARIIYPPYDDATAVLGAPCGGGKPACNPGLVCAMGSDNTQRCYEGCTPGSAPPLCPHGGSCDSTSMACLY